MTRSLIIAAVLGLAACAPEPPPQTTTGARPPAARPAPTAAFNPLDTGVAATPGAGGGGY